MKRHSTLVFAIIAAVYRAASSSSRRRSKPDASPTSNWRLTIVAAESVSCRSRSDSAARRRADTRWTKDFVTLAFRSWAVRDRSASAARARAEAADRSAVRTPVSSSRCSRWIVTCPLTPSGPLARSRPKTKFGLGKAPGLTGPGARGPGPGPSRGQLGAGGTSQFEGSGQR